MCYSAQIWADYRKYVKRFGARMSIEEFTRLVWGEQDKGQKRPKTPKAMDAAFMEPATAEEAAIRDALVRWNAQEASDLEQELFKQTKRKADAERTLQTKTTKAATESLRIAGSKVEQIKRRLADLKRTEPTPADSRIYPGYFAPVMIWEGGQRVIKPMRYQCRVEGVPASFDRQYPGTYNARRDSLEKYWRKLFGTHHGVVVANAFYEHVEKDGENVVLEFKPSTGQEMIVACLWSRWIGSDGEELLSFAAITDEPPAEVAAAGHDRCIIPIKAENVDAWLNPDKSNLAAQYAILDDRERPYYEHRMAA